MWLVICGLIIHVIFFLSVFDIYFRTPIIHGMAPEPLDVEPVAHRLVLFVADGLRADTLFSLNNGTTLAPFLRNVIEEKGTWGVSHTRVPTESRPGHVAIIGGIYEDPSAITHGWKENPVHFDTVFNRSRHTWSWGSPDILPMFAKGAKENHIDTFMYPAGMEDFGSQDASLLDTWVFQNVESLFKRAKQDAVLESSLKLNQTVFFIHLLGLDTNGHAHKPHSQSIVADKDYTRTPEIAQRRVKTKDEYLNNLRIVDKGIEKMVGVFEDFFQDDKTAFLFTSDHGMTDWGSHGAGDPSETETPIVAWGAGVALPEDPTNFKTRMLYDPRMEDWDLNHVRRHDVHQADLAPLMAALIGVPVPVNSVGMLPVEYLEPDPKYRAHSLYANARQILGHFRVRQRERAENSLTLIYKPFLLMLPEREIHLLTDIRDHLRNENFEDAIRVSLELMWLSSKGIEYYLNYDRPFLTATICFGFVGWILLLICQILKRAIEFWIAFVGWVLLLMCHISKDHTSVPQITSNALNGRKLRQNGSSFGLLILFVGGVALFLLIAQNAPWQHYVYLVTALFIWALLFFRLEYLKSAFWIMVFNNLVWEVAIRILVIFLGIEILVFSFFLRPLLSLGLVFIGFWPFILNSARSNTEKSLRLCWIGAATLLASFTYMPVVGKHPNYMIVELGGLSALFLLGFGLFCCGEEKWAFKAIPTVIYIQGGMILVSVYLVHTTAFSINIKEGLPFGNQVFSWLILGSSFLLPLLGSENVMGRLVAISASLLCPFVLLSIRHEVFFYASLGVAMFLWLILEYYLSGDRVQIGALKFSVWSQEENETQRQLSWSDIRRAYFFLFFIILSFFGTGNIASVNSFDPRFIYCFVTVFSPFVMGSLLLLKIIIPFLLVACFFKSVCFLLKVPVRSLFLVFLLLSDLMALQFFFLVRTEGSWLDIGSSLSHYVISMATTVFLMILMQMADILTTRSLPLLCSKDHVVLDVLPQLTKRQHRD